MENLNSPEDIERTTKLILENMKNVSAVNVDHSNYKNGGVVPPKHLDFDHSMNE